MMGFFLFSILFFANTTLAASEFTCMNTQRESLEEIFFYEMVEKNPFCSQAVKELKNKSYKDASRFEQVFNDEVEDIKKYFNHRITNEYGVISNDIKRIRKNGKIQKDLSPRRVKDKAFEGLKSSCDKLKHCVVSCKLSYTCGFYGSRAIGRVKELVHDLILGKGEADMQDILANEVGLSISKEAKKSASNYEELAESCEMKCASNILRLHAVVYEYNQTKFCR